MEISGHHLVGADGKPFFWLADTAWNLWGRGTPEEWDRYLAHRARQGFTAIQFVAGWWRGCTRPRWGRPYDVAGGKLVFDEGAWRSMDDLVGRIRAQGLVPAPVMLWTLTDIDPGQVLEEDQAIEVAARMRARWGDTGLVWLLGGDGDYRSAESVARWRRIGRAVFGDDPGVLATLHACGQSWPVDDFADEPWYRLATIQSGHGARPEELRWLTDGEYARAWRRLPMPFLNLEPNYEDARSYGDRIHLRAYHVRRASYWSVLAVPTAGVTYGINSVWIWASANRQTAENHDDTWVARPWHEDLDAPGAGDVVRMRRTFEALPWTDLRPCPERLAVQPGRADPARWQAPSATPDGRTAVVYAPTADPVAWEPGAGPRLEWTATDPSDGADVRCEVGPEGLRAQPTREGDVLYVGRAG